MSNHRGRIILKKNQTGPKFRKNYILAIAINEYSNGQTPLSHPKRESEKLIKILTERYDFRDDKNRVRRLYNDEATQSILYDELYDLHKDIPP